MNKSREVVEQFKNGALTSLEPEIYQYLAKKLKKELLKNARKKDVKDTIDEIERQLHLLFNGNAINKENTATAEKKKAIRDFLYLDSHAFESLLAQVNDGHVLAQIIECSNTHWADYIDINYKQVLDGKLNIGAFAFGGRLEKTSPSYNESSIDVARNIRILKQTDNIFNILHNYLHDNKMLVEENSPYVLGSYAEIKKEFNYINLNRFKLLTSNNLMKKYHSDDSTKNIVGSLWKIRAEIPSLKKLIPYNTFLYADNVIVLIDEHCLRDETGKIGFKFDSKATVLGRVSKSMKLSSSGNSDAINFLNAIQRRTLSILKELGFIQEDEVYFITPMAIYYEAIV